MMEVFTFGSNEKGMHGAGAAKFAHLNHGAKMGIGVGLQGSSYAIPTKDGYLETLPKEQILVYVKAFLKFSAENTGMIFNVTRIGCGLAGYQDQDIAPMFLYSSSNCRFPTEWQPWLGNSVSYHDLH